MGSLAKDLDFYHSPEKKLVHIDIRQILHCLIAWLTVYDVYQRMKF